MFLFMASRSTLRYGARLFRGLLRSRWLRVAQVLLGNRKQLLRLLNGLVKMLKKGSLAPVARDLRLFYHYVTDIVHGRYKDYKRVNLVLAVAVVAYVVSPFDFVPDWLPAVGLLDDVALVSYVVRLLDRELTRYRRSIEQQ